MVHEQGARLGRSQRQQLMRDAGVRWRAMTAEEKSLWKCQESPGGVSPDAAMDEVDQVVPLPPTLAREPALDSHETRFGEYVSLPGSCALAKGSYGRVITVAHERTARAACAKVFLAGRAMPRLK